MARMDVLVAAIAELAGAQRCGAEASETLIEVLDRAATAAERQAAAMEEQALAAWQITLVRAAYTTYDGDDAAILRVANTVQYAATMGIERVADAIKARAPGPVAAVS
jgi:hypothetical protein